jgi:hypothetical protein
MTATQAEIASALAHGAAGLMPDGGLGLLTRRSPARSGSLIGRPPGPDFDVLVP